MSNNFFEIKNVDFNVGDKTKVKDVSFSIEKEGDVICLLGPSGIGKTTILRTIAGLEKIKKGSIKLNGKTLSSENINIEPENRNVSLAFQDNSLFPHYTVEKNILLGSERNKEKKIKKLTLKEIVDLLDIFHILNKYPHEISAGEAQRASLARSLITQPDLLLLDEPLSNVDQSFKEEIQVRLKKILNKLKITTIIVTHDSYEAFYLGTKCGIILNEELKQFDDPYKVYHFPNSVEVVNFLNRGILVPAKVTGKNTLENWDLGTIEGNFIKEYPKGSNVQLLLQPEDLEHDDKSNLKLEVVDRKFRGTNFIYTLKTPSNTLIPVFVHSHHIHQHEVDEKFGVLAIEIGFTPFETMGMSLIIFGGASQIVLLQLFSGGASSLVIISSVGAVNSRHLLYGAVVSEHLSDLKIIWKIIISYFLIDQAFAMSNEYLKKNKDHNRYFHLVGGGATCWVIWQSTTFLGIILGAAIPEKLGLSFAVPLTFLALLVNDFRKFINVIVIIVSGLIATIGYNYIPFKAYILIAALAGLFTAMILTKKGRAS